MKCLDLALTCAIGVPLLTGCMGTDSGNPADPGGTAGGADPGAGNTAGPGLTGGLGTPGSGGLAGGEDGWGFGCEVVETRDLALDASTSLDVTAADVLALAEGEITMPLEWTGGFSEPSGGDDTRVTLEVTADPDGGARLVERDARAPSGGGPLPEIGLSDCSAQIEIDVRVHLSTDDGALDESFDAVLRSSDGVQASWRTDLDAEDVRGSFDYESSVGGSQWTAIMLSATHSALGTRGDIGVQGTLSGPGGGGFAGPAARFPGGDACQGAYAVALDAPVSGTSLEAVFEEAQGRLPAEILWPDTDPAALEWQVTLGETSGCAGLPGDGEQWTVLRAEGTATLRSEDSRLDAEVPVSFEAFVEDDGEVQTLRLNHGGRATRLSPDVLETTYGLTDVDVSGYAEIAVTLHWRWAEGDPVESEGALTVYGLDVPECISNPTPPPPSDGASGGGAPGCRGVDSHAVFEATF